MSSSLLFIQRRIQTWQVRICLGALIYLFSTVIAAAHHHDSQLTDHEHHNHSFNSDVLDCTACKLLTNQESLTDYWLLLEETHPVLHSFDLSEDLASDPPHHKLIRAPPTT